MEPFTTSEVICAGGFIGSRYYEPTGMVETESESESSDIDVQNENTERNLTSVIRAETNTTVYPLSQVDLNIFHEETDPVSKPIRNRKPQPTSWKMNMTKTSRMKGKEYIGLEKTFGIQKRIKTNRPSRKMMPRCQSLRCKQSKLKLCSDFSEETRSKLFKFFWSNLDWNGKRLYVRSLVDKAPVKHHYSRDQSIRQFTLIYTLKLGHEKRQVCREMFLATLGIKKRQVLLWMKGSDDNQRKMPEIQYTPTTAVSRPLNRSAKEFMMQFLKSLPKMPSHYCRQKSTKLYLEPILQSKMGLYRVYVTLCKESRLTPLSMCTLVRQFDLMNLSLFRPKKDQCNICVVYKIGNVTLENWNAHQKKKMEAREAKISDKKDAGLGKCHVLAIDLESVKLSPNLNANALYYKCKLIVHNFTVYDLNTHVCKCYWWNETEGELVASTFASCIVDFLKRYDDSLPITIYSDGCTYQNRNAIMSNALLRHSVQANKIIIQKYQRTYSDGMR